MNVKDKCQKNNFQLLTDLELIFTVTYALHLCPTTLALKHLTSLAGNCGSPSHIAHSIITSYIAKEGNDVVTYTCEQGYKFSDGQTKLDRQCQHGKWEPQDVVECRGT